MSTTALIEEITFRLRNRDYVWFRFTWSKVGNLPCRWIVWLETPTGTTLSFSEYILDSALAKLLKCLPEEQ